MRKQYSAIYKAEVVQQLLKEEKTVSQLASETGIHPTQLKEWKRIALTWLPELFSRNDRALTSPPRTLTLVQRRRGRTEAGNRAPSCVYDLQVDIYTFL